MNGKTELLDVIMNNLTSFNLPVASADEFYNWMVDNSSVYESFESYAVELKTKGNKKSYSARTIIERLRWDTLVSEINSKYKINNNFVPHMSRLAMIANPSLSGMFQLRVQQKRNAG